MRRLRHPRLDIAPTLVAILLDFAAEVRASGQRPIVILFEDRGYGTSLSAMVAPALKANGIDFVSSSSIASPYDSGSFSSDGHFVPAADERLAQEVLHLLRHANR